MTNKPTVGWRKLKVVSCAPCRGKGDTKKTVINKARQLSIIKEPCQRCKGSGEITPLKEKVK
ncbi:MAG: hypothetical protein DRH97_00365 [Chloroflexi bacterium]|nr:MAG: hypothetical protein DRH97_00365 [Chloroflexota bacterium]